MYGHILALGICITCALLHPCYTHTSTHAHHVFMMYAYMTSGTLIAWTTYPTYNSFYAPPFAQQAVAVNTYLAVLSSAVAAMIFSALFHPRFKLTITDAQR